MGHHGNRKSCLMALMTKAAGWLTLRSDMKERSLAWRARGGLSLSESEQLPMSQSICLC